MKKISLLTTCLFTLIIVQARANLIKPQRATANSSKSTFIRVFDKKGKKIYKGYLEALSDTSFTLSGEKQSVEIPVSRVGVIKLRHSIGHTILVTSVTTGIVLAIAFAATADPDALIVPITAGEGFVIGLLYGGIGGIPLGALIGGTRNRPVFLVNGNQSNWIKIKEALKKYLPAESPAN